VGCPLLPACQLLHRRVLQVTVSRLMDMQHQAQMYLAQHRIHGLLQHIVMPRFSSHLPIFQATNRPLTTPHAIFVPSGDRLVEAQHINRSLSALGDVMAALASKSQHIPFRNSKLTQLLADSLCGQAKVGVWVCGCVGVGGWVLRGPAQHGTAQLCACTPKPAVCAPHTVDATCRRHVGRPTCCPGPARFLPDVSCTSPTAHPSAPDTPGDDVHAHLPRG
jgi:hypothetical protein